MADQTPDQLISSIFARQLAMLQQITALAGGQGTNQGTFDAHMEYFQEVTEADFTHAQKIMAADVKRATRIRPRDLPR